MNYLHYEWYDIGPDDLIEVTLDKQANVRLMDTDNFQSYHRSGQYRYFGGLQVRSPERYRPPSFGHWHLVIDLGGAAGTVNAGVRLL
jgi:hypothetical protein